MSKSNINTAFELLLGEIEKEIDKVNVECKIALDAREYDKIKALSEYGKHLEDFKGKVKDLEKGWQSIYRNEVRMNGSKDKIGKQKKLKKGLRTPEKEYEIPILEALVELGGKGKAGDVLDRVYEKMKDRLNEYDKQLLGKNNQKRWRNTARWASNTMYHEKGFLKKDREMKVWEITEEGRKYYESSKGNLEMGNFGGIEV